MSTVEVRQIGHVATAPVTETLSIKGRSQTKVSLTVISNARWKDAQGKPQEKATAINWTLWGKVAMNASWYLIVGSKVEIAGRMESRRYTNKEGKEVFGFEFTARGVQYLETKAQSEARRANRSSAAETGKVSADRTTPASKRPQKGG